jgi:hypothetical protein
MLLKIKVLTLIYLFNNLILCGQNTPLDSISNFKITYNSIQETWSIFPLNQTQSVDYQYLLEYSEMRDYGIALEKFAFTPQFSFRDSLEIKAPVRLKIAPFKKNEQCGQESYFELKKHQGLGLPIQILQNEIWLSSELLTDGVLGNLQNNPNVWQAFSGENSSIYLDYQEISIPKNISLSFLTNVQMGVFLPKTIEYYTSEDGENWDFAWVNSFENTDIPKNPAIFKSVWDLPKDIVFKHLMIVLVPTSVNLSLFKVDEILVK